MERRLAAILVADVVGYSRLMAADERGTHDRLKDLRVGLVEPLVAAHHGRIVKLSGDGALVEFPSVVDAVECAVEVQSAVAERNGELPDDQHLRFRIGINIGDIILEDGDIYGDGVNVASRLEGLADPGGICVARNVYNQVKNKLAFGFEPMGEHQVKNIAEPVTVYRVLAELGPIAKTVGLKRAGTPKSRWKALVAAVAIVVMGGGAAWWYAGRPVPTGGGGALALWSARQAPKSGAIADQRRVAVLPFANMSADPSNGYFADGITEEIITELSKIRALSVIARTSIIQYKQTEKSIATIGAELDVGSILEGSVRRAGDQVRITAQLIDVSTQAHLWAEGFDRPLERVFDVQSEIAEKVAANLEITILEDEKINIRSADTNSVEAHNLYLKANHLNNQQSAEGALAAIELLKEAVKLDPSYANAFAALADYSNQIIWFADIHPQDAHEQAKRFANEALKIDPDSARAHLALAQAKMWGDFDWDGAEKSFEKAIQLNPSFARAHQFYGHFFLLAVRRADDPALAELIKAVELDPLSAEIIESRGWVHYHRREYDQAIRFFEEMRDLHPDAVYAYAGLGQSQIRAGTEEEGLANLHRAVAMAPNVDFFLSFLGWGLGYVGRLDDAREVLTKLEASGQSPMSAAWTAAGMGAKEEAIDWLERAWQEREASVIFVRIPDFHDLLALEPRYQALLREMGVEDQSL